MRKRLLSLILAMIICMNSFQIETYAKENKAYEAYQEAIQVITSCGDWTENLVMTADMSISQGSAKTKTKVTINSNMDVSNYSSSDISDIKMAGSADMSIMGQKYAWNMQYENGIAHYEYTEPNQTTADVEMDPNCFDFSSMSEDMMENAKVFGNKIIFTISADKMEEAGIAAVNMMSGIENLRYGDVDVEVLLDRETGAIEELIMDFHATLNYQGYQAEVDYQIEYSFMINDANYMVESIEDDITEIEIEDGIVIYSDYQNLSVRKDRIITLSAGIVIGGKEIDNVSGITFGVDDPSILEITDTGIENNYRYVKFNAIDVGTTYVYFSDSNTGYATKVPVTIYEDNYLSYTLSSVPTQYIEKYPTNIYNANGLYIDSYTYTVNDDKTAKVSFDVYNANYTYGVVEVYNEYGTLKDAVLIKKMSSNNTSIRKTLWDNTGCLIRDIIDGDILSYRQESGYSKKTTVNINIPKNGYIKICNDPKNSAIVNIINSVDVLMSLGKFANKVKNYDINGEVFSEKLTAELLKEKTFAVLVEDGSKLQEDLWKGVAEDAFFSTESLGDFCNTVANNLSKFDLGELISDTARDFGWSVGEDVFKYFSGPVKMALDGVFAIGKLENIIMQHTDLIKSANVGSIYIQNQGGGMRSSQQITVKSDTGFSENVSLNVFKVALETDMLDVLKNVNVEVYEKFVNGTTFSYNISLMANGTETQPDEEVTVYIPIPEDLKLLAYAGKTNIYRIESDGNATEMDIEIKDGCFVFNTTHFSLYTLVGSSIISVEIVAMTALIVIILIGMLILLFKVKKRKN